ncbi:hypothetical protein VKT23_012638 [Stygiomarasmius scandens]|uniref:F-box domain-containing protein n=1 Tax=Marasmiellus scandens TaxID=2682957 RepID=A0ABR1JAC8_9AGAR
MEYLPTELLNEIFFLSCGIGQSSGFSNIQPEAGLSDHVRPPATPLLSLDESSILVISAVCKDWRVISLASQRLWSKVEIREELRSTSRDRIHTLKNLLKLHLARSGEYPLDIVFEFTEFSTFNSSMDWEDDYPWDSNDDRITQAGKVRLFYPLFQLLCNETQRWKSAHLCLYRTMTLSYRSGWPHELDVPLLEHLHIHAIGHEDDCVGIRPSISICSAPVLHTFICTGSILACTTTSNSGNFLPSLRVLHFHSQCRWVEKLAGPSTRLTFRDICVSSMISSEEDSHPVTCLARAFDLRTSSFALENTLYSFNLPNLVELAVELPKEERMSLKLPHVALKVLLRRSNASSVTHLMLARFYLSDVILMEILKQLPAITHLAVGERYSDIDPEYSGSEVYPADAKFPLTASLFNQLPKTLKEIHLAFHVNITLEDILALLDILNLRVGHSGILRYLWLIVAKSDSRITRVVEGMNKDGLDCELDQTSIDTEKAKECCGIGKWKV